MPDASPAEPRLLENKVAIVTGAGRGIGRAEALALAGAGAAVVVNDVDAAAADLVVSDVRRAGGTAVACASSVMTPSGGAAATETALREYGTVDVVVNNAGFLRPALFEDLSVDDIDAVLDVHLRGAFYVTQPAWRVMKAKASGRVVLTGSSAGMFSQSANSNYCAAKAGVFGLARALASEGAEFGIGVNVVLPFAATTISTRNPIPGNAQAREREGATYRGAILDRRGPELVTPLVTYLASDACRSTGNVYSACAGRFARAFVGLGGGWLVPDPTTFDTASLAAHLDAVESTAHASEPRSLFEEVAGVMAALDGAPTPT